MVALLTSVRNSPCFGGLRRTKTCHRQLFARPSTCFLVTFCTTQKVTIRSLCWEFRGFANLESAHPNNTFPLTKLNPFKASFEVLQTSKQRTQTTTSCNLIKSCRKLFPTFCKAQKVDQKSLPAGSSPPLAAYIQKELPKQLLLYHHGRFSYPASVIAVLTSFKVG